jgi:hypothetical protein
MKHKRPKPPAATPQPQEGLENPKAQVVITERAPSGDEILQYLKRDPAQQPRVIEQLANGNARLLEARPLIQKAEIAKRTIAEANQKSQRDAAAKYQTIRKFAGQVIAADPKLQRATANRLAKVIHKRRPDWSERTIRRALKK